jgi:hypothetical protein
VDGVRHAEQDRPPCLHLVETSLSDAVEHP